MSVRIGDIVTHKGAPWHVVSSPMGGLVEIAPTPHGAGSIVVTLDILKAQEGDYLLWLFSNTSLEACHSTTNL